MGNFYFVTSIKRICDSRGKELSPENIPGLQFINSVSAADVRIYFGTTNPGLVNQCKSTFRPPIDSSQKLSGFDGSYKGQYVETQSFRKEWLMETNYETISEIKQCILSCDKNQQRQERCLSDLSIKFFSTWGTRGKCYPDSCSAAGVNYSEAFKVDSKIIRWSHRHDVRSSRQNMRMNLRDISLFIHKYIKTYCKIKKRISDTRRRYF